MRLYFEIAIILVLILANGFLSMAEMALISARKVRLRQQLEEGDPRAARALALAESPGRMLSTVQIGMTAIGILTGTFGSRTLSASLATFLAQWPVLAPYASAISVTTVSYTHLTLPTTERV